MGGYGSHLESPRAQWRLSFSNNSIPLAESFYCRKKAELDEAGYSILENMADPMAFQEDGPLVIPEDFPKMTLNQFMERIVATFPGEEMLRDEDAWRGWRPIINSGDETKDQDHRDAGIGRFSSTPWLTCNHLEDSEERVPVAGRIWMCGLGGCWR